MAALAVALAAGLEFSPLQPFGVRGMLTSNVTPSASPTEDQVQQSGPTTSTLGPTADSATGLDSGLVGFPDRAAGDRSAETGAAVPLGDWEVTVDRAVVETDADGREQLVVSVAVTNRSAAPRLYKAFFWELREPKGERLLILPIERPGTVPFKELGPGEQVSAVVVFGTGAGNHILLFEDLGSLGAGRLVWQVRT